MLVSQSVTVLASKYQLGARIREAREASGLSRAALGALVSRAPGTIQAYENGGREPGVAEVSAIAEATGRPLPSFYAYGESLPEPSPRDALAVISLAVDEAAKVPALEQRVVELEAQLEAERDQALAEVTQLRAELAELKGVTADDSQRASVVREAPPVTPMTSRKAQQQLYRGNQAPKRRAASTGADANSEEALAAQLEALEALKDYEEAGSPDDE